MRQSHATLYARVLASDASCDGRFFFGVTTTGIYCLPSCKARKPKPENVRFFPSCSAARAAGLRACRKCHPDDFAHGADPVLETIETLVGEIRARPHDFPDVRAIVRRAGFGTTRVFELFRQHYHATPADLLLRARLEFAERRLLASRDGLLEIAASAGFASASAFHDQFRRRNGLTPAAYRELREDRPFALTLPPGYPLDHLRRVLGRDPHSLTTRLEGDTFTAVTRIGARPLILRLRLAPDRVAVAFSGGTAPDAHRLTRALLGLDQPAATFARLARRLGLARLVAGRDELRLPQTTSLFEGILWAIIGQQINFPFACLLQRRLFERVGEPMPDGGGLLVPPTPAAVATLDPGELRPLQFSRQKADYLISTARLIADGRLDIDALLSMSATRADRTLLAVRGLGPWSVNYLLMRSLGFPDCVPWGDTGVSAGLRALHRLDQSPDLATARRLMAPFSPYRSLATAHLWHFSAPSAP